MESLSLSLYEVEFSPRSVDREKSSEQFRPALALTMLAVWLALATIDPKKYQTRIAVKKG